MVNSFASHRSNAPLLMLLALCGGSAMAAGKPGVLNSKEPITVESGPTDIDAVNHLVYLHHGVKITQGGISVAADEAQATGLDFNNSKWVFTGKVHIRAESQGDLRSDKANVTFSDNVLARATVSGSPAQFEQTQSANGLLATGHAGTIDYDVVGGTVTLSGDAWLIDGPHKMDAPTITYNVRARQIQGDSSATPGGRVHMVIVPKGDAASGPAAPDHDAGSGPAKP